MTITIARPTDAALTGYTLGGGVAMYPAMLPRTVLLQLMITLAFGAIGAAAGSLLARYSRRAGLRSSWSARLAAYLLSSALIGWLLWQNHLRDAAQADPIGPLGFILLAAGTGGAPLLIAALFSVRGRLLAASLSVVAAVGVAWPAHAALGDDAAGERQSYAERFTAIASATPGVRIFASIDDGAGPSERAAAAVDRLIAAGGLSKHTVAMAVPTGSGWVDPRFVRGLEERTHGDSAIVAVQYTQQPSWQSFVLHREAAAATSVALIDELHRRAPSLRVLAYGQSLGSVGVVAAHARAQALGHPLAATMQVGTPASIAVVGPAQLNASDPVGIWSPALVFAPPARSATAPGKGTPRPPWVPVVSFLQTSLDLLGATATPAGLGHRYDDRQGSDLAMRAS